MNKRYDFKEIEKRVSEYWKKNKVPEKTVKYESKKKMFSFLEGPPTANAPPGLHHVEARVFKDLFNRYKYMQGFTVPRKAGWDCHGLPVEVQVEKKLGLKNKKEVQIYGVKKFVTECKKDVFSFIDSWVSLSNRMAFWLDYKNRYATLDQKYMESEWWALKQIYDKGLLYLGNKVVPYCPRCGTPLSSHEVALGYEDVTEKTVVVKFRLKNNSNRFMLVWTTTPWTLPSNLGLAVNKETEYAIVEKNEKEFIIAKLLVKKYFGEQSKIKQTIKGKELIGQKYEPLFDYFKNSAKNSFKIIHGDFVTTEEGTGIVHMAPAFGEDDYNASKENGLDFVQPVDKDGKFTSEVKDFEGMFVKKADKTIIEKLENENKLFTTENYTHSYPFCWRCKTPLIYFAMDSWFIKVTRIKEKLIKNNKKINWIPNHMKAGRFGKWLEGAKDWALSRNKFWGTPLNIWICQKCEKMTSIGSLKELKQKAINAPKKIEMHKPEIDEIKLKCSCGEEMNRTPEVIDTWFDSGSDSYAQYHYPFENKQIFEKSYPYDFIAEGVDQTRGWFYTLHVLGTILFNSNAYKTCVSAGLMVDQKGEKMSKSKGNTIEPNEAFDQVGVDALRLQFCLTSPESEKRFGIKSVGEIIKPFMNIYWNSFVFSQEMLSIKTRKPKLQKEDEWIISRTNSTIKKVTEAIEKHDYHHCTSAIISLVNEDLSRTYIKLVRERATEKNKAVSYSLKYVFEKTALLLAPFAPYLSEETFFQMKKNKSIHLEKWPKAGKINSKLEENMGIAKEIIQAALYAREKSKINLRWPIKTLIIETKEKDLLKKIKPLEKIIKHQSNVKKITEGKTTNGIEFYNGKIGLDLTSSEELEAEGYARELMRRTQNLRKTTGLQKNDKIELFLQVPKELEKSIRMHSKTIQQKVGAKTITIESTTPKKKYSQKAEESIKTHTITIYLKKV